MPEHLLAPADEHDNGRRRALQRHDEARENLSEHAAILLDEIPERPDLDRAGVWIGQLELFAARLEDAKLLVHFLQGEWTRRAKEANAARDPADRETGLTERYADAFNFHENSLRYAMGCAESFGGNIRLFDRWLLAGKQKRWYHVQEVTRAHVDPSVLGVEEYSDYIVRRVERAAETVAEANEHFDDEQRKELAGPAGRLADEADEFRRKGLADLEDAEQPTPREQHDAARSGPDPYDGLTPEEIDERERTGQTPDADAAPQTDGMTEAERTFKGFVVNLDCAGCGTPPEPGPGGVKNDPHHVAPSGVAIKNQPFSMIPLCRDCHQLIHGEGYRAFKRETRVDVRQAVADTLHKYLWGDAVRWPPGIEEARGHERTD